VQRPEFIVLYRWRLRPGYEEKFKKAWSIVTQALIDRGSLGSRLHQGDDGLWYSYAQWPSKEARAAAFAQPLDLDDEQRSMNDAVSEHFPEIILAPSVDHLLSHRNIPGLRVARPTKDFPGAITFWTRVVGLEILTQFEDHDGYNGAILGHSQTPWELEITHHSSGLPLPSPTDEDIIVLYADRHSADEIINRLLQAGHLPIEHPNPYWRTMGASVHTDPDGYTLIIYPED
jgi:catechol 2,3-dioxygenase-like lactoylglutathione lyase family enzyme